jgi:CheY-like chemotaxis protein
MLSPSPNIRTRPRLQPSRPTIMVVEDDSDNRLMLKTLLEMKGYGVIEARDGLEAVRVLEDARPQLILMDLQIPHLDGFDVARRVRQHPQLGDVPIIIISGHDPARHSRLARAAGCNEYFLKPIDFDRLEQTLAHLLPAS